MSIPAIHQFVAGFAPGDAISNEARNFQAIFKSWGSPTNYIFAERRFVALELQDQVKDIFEDVALVKPNDIALLHLSIGCNTNQVFKSLPCKKVILYHNITPADFFRGYNEHTASALAKGRREAADLAKCCDVALACSKYNAEDLAAWGYPSATVLPLVLDLDVFKHRPVSKVFRTVRDGKTNILFVGRCAPNKRIEDLLNAFYFYQHYVNPNSRLIHVGNYDMADPYHVLLLARTVALRLKNVMFTGAVNQPNLNAYFQSADVFLCMSEHEGFCVPIIEAMANHIPVLAYAAGAVPETMDGAGVLFHQKDFALIAETIDQLAKNTALRKAVLKAQEQRLARFCNTDLKGILRTALSPLFA